jgi:broad specificity polyphosphatase/5'/3'-nucleotidase SurE
MRYYLFLAAALPLTRGVRIIQSNDDGWSEKNLRVFFDVLNSAGHQVVLSGPAENQSGTGMLSNNRLSASTDCSQARPMLLQPQLTEMAVFMRPVPVGVHPLEPTPAILG